MRYLLRILLLSLCCLGAVQAADDDASALLGAIFPALDGTPTAMASLKGKPAVVNFWARWCGPCRREIPDLAALKKEYGDALHVVGIGVEALGESARDFAAAYEMHYTVVFAGAGGGVELMKALGNDMAGLPFTVVLDAEGRIVARKLGVMSPADMRAAVAPLL